MQHLETYTNLIAHILPSLEATCLSEVREWQCAPLGAARVLPFLIIITRASCTYCPSPLFPPSRPPVLNRDPVLSALVSLISTAVVQHVITPVPVPIPPYSDKPLQAWLAAHVSDLGGDSMQGADEEHIFERMRKESHRTRPDSWRP